MNIICSISGCSFVGCLCKRCGKQRDKDHRWNHCKCQTCGKLRFHEWNANICNLCGYEIPVSSLIHSINQGIKDKFGSIYIYSHDREKHFKRYLNDINMLGSTIDPHAIPIFIKALDSSGGSRVEKYLLDELVKFGDSASEALIEHFDKAKHKQRIIFALSKFGGDKVIKKLEELLEDESSDIRFYASDSLLRLNWQPTGQKQKFLYALAKSPVDTVIDLIQNGEPSADPVIKDLINSAETFKIILDSVFELNESNLDTHRLKGFILLLKNEYQKANKSRIQEDIKEAALLRRGEDGAIKAIEKLIVMQDFSIMPQLLKKAEDIHDEAAGEDTSHGGTTIGQWLSSYVDAIERMEEKSKKINLAQK